MISRETSWSSNGHGLLSLLDNLTISILFIYSFSGLVAICPHSSVVEHFIRNEKVHGSIPCVGCDNIFLPVMKERACSIAQVNGL